MPSFHFDIEGARDVAEGVDDWCSSGFFFCVCVWSIYEKVGTKIIAFNQKESELMYAPIQSLLLYVISS